ncbi:MAG: FAD-dependent oxidoreductase, partial [Candidatus Micrarchaeia archaeon]
ATCDGYFFKDKPVVLVGGGNTAVTYALFMAGIASKVYVVHRRDEFRAENALVERLKTSPKVQLVLNSVVERIEGTGKVERVIVKDVNSGKQSVINADAIFISVGEVPRSGLAQTLGIALDERGYIKTNERQETSLPGVYAAGDVCGKGWPQAINAAAQGMTAGIECSRYVQQLKKTGK